ncbi:relaxase/mobilization nuclease domain-containing protein (plasmid) [Carnobacterium maltaromaticum]|uniref:relaxase/mobilization nuclease domain-containing protein n=1 Tax=Carnobacterium maltaromaticum TaxID=2751 RepID=UPI00344BBF8E
MVYTKHFVIHTFDQLHDAEKYITDAMKTIVEKSDASSHLNTLFRYVASDDKTMMKQLVSSHGIIDIENAYEEFKYTKLQSAYKKGNSFSFDSKNGRMRKPTLSDLEKNNAVLAHHLIQSFSPDDRLTPEQIHEIGRKTVLELTGGTHEFVIATHVDKDHIHNHIVFNSTNMKSGNAFRWQKGTKNVYEQISDKIASKEGAKIIEKSPKNSHKKYTMYQTESIFKQKIKSRLDFLMDHSSSLDDFLIKAEALELFVDFSKKWSTFRLLDEPQVKNTRGRSLFKKEPNRYDLEKIVDHINMNTETFTVEDVVSRYEEKVNRKENDFDYQITLESWQISHKTTKGYYLNVDFGFGNHGQLFIGAYKVDALDNGDYNLFVKRNDYFYFMNDQKADRSRYMTGETLIRQLQLYNGVTPLKKEPVMSTIDELVDAINFLAEHEITDGRQLNLLEEKLENVFTEAEAALETLDEKIIELHQVGKLLLEAETNEDKAEIQDKLKSFVPNAILSEITFEDVQSEISSASKSLELLETKLEQTVKKMNHLHEIQAVTEKNQEKPTQQRL